MRTFGLGLLLIVGLALTSCNRDHRRNEPSSREVGRDAYRATQEIKRDVKKAGKAIQKAGKDVREGWNEARHDDPPPKK